MTLVKLQECTYKLLMNPLGAFSQKLEVWVGVNVENIDQLSLEQSANVHPLFVDLLDSKKVVSKTRSSMAENLPLH